MDLRPKTHEFLGEREVATADLPKSGIKKGDVLGNTSVLRRAIVDKAGQRP
ncbi:hypothetical protein [Streptomyces sp. HUAS TT20]|uniref:hypothetical protein n=1 Tax=Streptomyces sp. HUAS TT20 TaxID=3447509 RepID=UPI0021DA67F7|nr:hypothetical protein [Streptomyces sp. HUAS 15-9]UXY29129.1 hypothetical protein N8I87_22950 [Streptomyces sp. HUAS 15-9]